MTILIKEVSVIVTVEDENGLRNDYQGNCTGIDTAIEFLGKVERKIKKLEEQEKLHVFNTKDNF